MEKPNTIEETGIPDAILQKGIAFDIEIANPGLLHKLGLRKLSHSFVIKPILNAPLFEVCSLLEKIDFKDVENLKLENNALSDVLKIMCKNIIAHTDKMNKILAWAIFNKKKVTFKDKLYFNWLVRLINDNLDTAERVKLLNVVIKQMGTQSFLSFMVSIRGMNLMATGQTSGELLEASTPISDLTEKL